MENINPKGEQMPTDPTRKRGVVKIRHKTEIRHFAAMARESLRDLERALRENDLTRAVDMAAEASGLCGEAENLLRDQEGS